MVSSPKRDSRIRAFDLILNLGVHANLLEPMMADDASAIEEDYSQEPYFDDPQFMSQGSRKGNSCNINISSAIGNFESWILNILYEILLLLVQVLLIFSPSFEIFLQKIIFEKFSPSKGVCILQV